ncbi:DUF2268 domain-containing putative Zn-dependent protease [Peribacillus acanthi]|uniref:DUF2268 domain-containing putative Zn-dependent protease n=1 Tax=Peribacillus acanthi TaxID=2171554 RepID=UPI000D3E6DF2|nr:DUF2268 domain-containing putative Zn-dependent protease [Peribacillus acanthi]
MIINQITPQAILDNKSDYDTYLKKQLSPLVGKDSWMQDWRHIAQRFGLLKFQEMKEEELQSYEWDEKWVHDLIEEAILKVKEHLELGPLNIMVVPAIAFPWFRNLDRAIWTNGFTNGPNTIILAVPPKPDAVFLQYMIAHEAHHASPQNPIYQLTLDTFTLQDWYKMEGTAEYFSLSLYEDKRWWKDEFTKEIESNYWNRAKNQLHFADENGFALRFGDPANGIPYLAGYAFAYNLVRDYVKRNSIQEYKELFLIKASEYIDCYKVNN